ncbi:MAG: glycosyltransferase family 4 protein [Myxococcaceae bacterium]|nr:glycosyltransferase family 4 protein [Myxococcaceae bacterium]
MKIAMLTDRVQLGGGCEHIRQLAMALPRHEFVVCGDGGGSRALAALPNVTLQTRGCDWKTVASHRPDLVHVHHLRALCALLVGWGEGRLPSLPIVNTLHGVHVRRYDFARFPQTLPGIARKALERSLFQKVAINVALTEDDARLLRELYGLRNVRVIANGIDHARLRAEVARENDKGPGLRQTLGLTPDRRLLLTLARLDFAKGVDILIEAVARAQERLRQRGDCFAIVGDGPLRGELERLARRRGVTDLVAFVGAVSGARRFLVEAKALIIPSRWEGLPLVLLEAGSLGRPVIAARVAGIAGIIEDGVSGRLFDCGDAAALARLLVEDIADEMGANLRARVLSDHDSSAMARAHEALYDALVSRGLA